ncbi:MAG: hypothetical protein ACE5NP_07430 [Anaerolineae bacterium]
MRSNRSREEELERQGWVRRFIAEEPRLSEAVELYESLNLEVLLEPVKPDEMNEECSLCYKVECDKYKVIYTKRREQEEVEETLPFD